MKSFKFDLQRFDALTINAGETQTLDGVTYTALNGDAVLKYDDDFKVSGLTSGKVSAVVAGASDSSTLTIDATDGSTDFTLTGNGEVLTLTKVLPFELDNGTFTLASNVLTAAKGSDLKIGNGKTYGDGSTVFGHDYADTEVKYTITDTALTEETEKETITFTASLGEQSRSITTFVNGTIINGVDDGKFTGGFTISKDSSMGLVLGDYTLKATANADATSQILVNSDGANITPGSGDGTLNVSLTRGDTTIFGGALECTSGKITLGYDHAVTFTEGTSFNFTWNNYVSTITATGDATTAIALTDSGITFTPGSGDGGLNLLLTKDGTPIFAGELNISDGSITFNSDEQKFSFTEGTKISLGIGTDGSRAMDFEVTGGNASFKMAADENGNFTITPDENDGSLSIALKQNGETVFQNTVTVNGAMTINPVTDLLTLTDGTTFSLAFNNYTMTATADGDAASKISLTASGISITPQEGDGTLKLTLDSTAGSGSINADVEILSGGFLFGTSGALSVTEGTELQIKFSDDYIVNFKATDAAGGALSIGTDGLTFAPGSDDGGLELSVTRNGETRTASLDVTGSLTYKLDGSISLSEGTVVKNVFEDGNILTITALTDASGSILFTPDDGITITPAEPTALNVLFSGGGGEVEVFNITSIDGSINYKGGVITASDGTEVLFTNYYMESEMKLSTDGGSSSLEITEDSTSYIANAGATFVLDYQDGTTLEITEGTFIDDYEHAIITAGATFKTNDDEDYFYLQTAGNYNLNGMNVTTTLDNVPIILGEDSIIFNDLTYKLLDENVTLTIGENSIACTGGKANVAMSLLGMAFDFDATSGSFTFDRTNSTFSIEAGTVISMAQGDSELQVTALEDTSATLRTDDEGIIYCDWADTTNSTLSIVRDGQTVIALPFTLTGTTSYLPSAGTFALVYNQDNQTDATATIGLANYEIQLSTPDNTFVVGLETSDDGKVTVNYPREEYSTMNLLITRDDEAIFGGALSVDGSVVFDPTNHTLTLTDGTSTEMTFGGYTLKTTANGDATSAFAIVDEGLVITPNTGDGTLQLEFGNGTASMTAELEILNGSFTLKQGGALTVAKDTELKLTFSDDYSISFKTTDAAGGNLSLGTDGITFTPGSDDGGLELSVTKDGVTRTTSLNMTGSLTYNLDGSTVEIQNGSFSDIYATETSDAIELVSEGSTFKANDDEFVFTLEKASTYNLNGIDVTTSQDNVEVLLSNYDTVNVDGISYTPLDENAKLTIGDNVATVEGGKVSMQMDGFDKIFGADTNDGSISYDSSSGKFTIAQGTKTYLGNGAFPDQFVAQSDFDITVEKNSDGTFTFTSDDSAAIAIERDGKVIMSTAVTVDGSIIIDPTNNQINVPKGTVLTLTPSNGKELEIKALDDAGGQLSLVDGGLRFAPNENDGALEFNFVNSGRKVQLDVTGAFTYKGLGALSLEDGTEATFTWEDGNILKLTSSGSTGSIGLDPNLGIKITSDDENLSMTFTTPSMSTDISGIKGTIYYNAGVVSFDENSTITATTTLGGQPILTTLETIDGTGHISFNTTNGVIYAADMGAMRITWTKDDLESTFTVNSGSIQIGHNLFRITEGSDIVTDLKTFVPALYFTTDEAGTYTINGQTITTSAEGLALTATDDQMVFTTSDDNAVEYEGMNFAGAGKVSLSPDNVVLGAGVEATGFGEENSFVLAEAGNVTADAKIFELSKIEGTPREIPMIITVTGAQDGFVFSRTLTKESEAYLDDALDDEKFENYTSSYIGQVFTEKFISAGDSSYRIRTDAIGLEEVIGISDGATVTGGASLADEPTLSYYNLVTDTEGTFTIGEKAYNVSGDSSVAIRARFEVDTAPYASYVDSLNGTISGDFSGGAFKINGSSSLQVTGDSSIEIVADASGFEILGLDAGASLKVEAADTYVVNGTTINANAGDYIVGLGESSAFLTGTNNNTLITGTDSDDYIANSGASVTINAGTGDDSITNTGDNVLFQYSGGNDSISGFNATSTLSISGSEYSTATSGDDLIVTVGESKITLINAASLSSANIETPDPIVQLVEAALKRTAAGYPAIAAVAFHPNEDLGDEPTNYSDKEDWSITSTDNLKLHAVHYTPENSNDKWVVLIHGYGHSHDAMYQYATAYLANGYNVLMIDQRAAGESEGTWLTMGAAESEDVALWTQEIARRNSNAKITLHGISMGSATAMLAAARSDATNVTSLVEDCGYTNVLDVFSIINDAYLKQPSEVVTAMDPVAASLTGYYLHEAAPIDSISSATMPSIFITGDADSVVPMSMFTELYDASGAEVKEQFIVKDATHGRAGLTDSIGYSNAVFRFVAEADGEGWVTENTTDEITLRGTKYDDTITNSGYFVAIAGLSGNDSIVNEGEYTSINGGAGNDTISNSGASSIIEGDAGADVITNSSSTAMIRGGGGADTISNTGDNVTVDGGAGNDSIYNDASNVTFTYAAGAGDDTISGFNETSTLRIATDEYSSAKSGDDLIVTVGENSITLKDAAGLSVANIVNGGLNIINTENNTLITGTAFDDFISNSGTKVTIDTADGDDLVINNVDSSLVAASLGNSIEAGNGNDTIYSHHTYNPTIAGGAGDDSIVVSRGHLTYIDGGAGNDSIIGELTNRTAGNWRMGGYATILGGAGDDYIDPGYSDHSTINGGEGNDTILNNGISSTLDGGTGNNLIRITNIAEGAGGQFVVLNGNTTVEGFNTGFGEGTDTMYIDGDPAGVYFNDDVLTFSNSTDSLTFSDVTTTAKVNIYHKSREVLNKGVFIAEDDWYSVTADDLTVNAGEEVYFVGPSATEKHGVDFSGITSDLNVTIDTAYIDSEDYVPGTTTWINGVYSLRGGAGNTTITGSNKADTIIAGTGATTINAGAGENFVNLEDAESALIQLAGNTTLKGFKTGFGEGTDTIYIDGDPAGVYFNDGVLAFSNSTDSLTLSDVTTTAKVNIYHKRREMLNKGVFIAAGDWYKVEDSDLTVDAGEEVYFVGTAADPKAGVDFSDISSALNITMNTAYIDSEDYVPGTTTWINGVYSLKGGAGLTTVTGSDQSDTILAGTGKTTINAGAGDDVISLQSSAALVQYNAGDGNDSISNFNSNSTLKIAGETYTSTKSGDDLIFSVGDDKITLAGAANLSAVNVDGTSETDAIIESIGADNYSVVSAGETSAQNISLDGGELVVVEDTSAKVSLTASKGSDTIYSAGDNVTVNLTGGATNLIAAGGKMTVENYNATTGAAFVTNYDNILTEVDGGAIYFEKGKMSVDSAIVDFNGINSGIVNFYDASGELQKVAPVSPDESLDLSKETDNFILVADKYSTLTGGKGNDSLFAFAGSRVNESAGKNYIEIDKRNSYDDGVKISLGGGKTTIKNFNTGFDDTSDRFFGGVNDSIDLKFDGVDLKYYINGELCGIATDISSDEPFVNITAEDANGPVKIAVAQENAVITVDDELADLYIGEKSGVDFTNYEGNLSINLGSEEGSLGTGEVLFSGINQVSLGSGVSSLIGSASRETLAAGTGAATINGGAGNDLLIGNTSADKDGATEFVFETSGGRDTVSNFEFLTDSNLMTADRISVDSAVTNVVVRNSGDVIIQRGEDWLTLENAQGKQFKINDLVATVDKNDFEFDGTTNYFLATGKRATLTVGEDVVDEAIIWLGNQQSNQFVGDFRTIDASNLTAKAELAGNDLDNVICAGKGDAILWGGNGGDDLLIGGKAHNLFFYAAGDGNDTIQSANDGDAVILSNISIDQILATNITADGTTINFKDGGTLNVASTNAVEFAFNDATYLADHSTGTWQQK